MLKSPVSFFEEKDGHLIERGGAIHVLIFRPHLSHFLTTFTLCLCSLSLSFGYIFSHSIMIIYLFLRLERKAYERVFFIFRLENIYILCMQQRILLHVKRYEYCH
mmetsp:Transcript_14580/g.19454  ORF Transcript_14580/g.19454 Transcript_14580/m.19454 type:complete len:105 (+) Transcript_14580:1039-1353(+)